MSHAWVGGWVWPERGLGSMQPTIEFSNAPAPPAFENMIEARSTAVDRLSDSCSNLPVKEATGNFYEFVCQGASLRETPYRR